MATEQHTGVELWTIGSEDGNPRAFSATLLTQADNPVAPYVVGESEPGKHWPRLHSGPYDWEAGFSNHTLTVQFTLAPDDAEKDLAIALDFFASHGACPDLELAVNGVSGRVASDVVRNSAADGYRVPAPTAGRCHRVVDLPAGAVRAGSNTLTVTTVPPRPDAEPPVGTPKLPHNAAAYGSAITWRKLALVWRESGPDETRMGLTATPFYVETDAGLAAVVEAVVTSPQSLGVGELELELGGERHRRAFAGHAFGDTRVRFTVPEWEGPVPSELRLEIPGSTVLSSSEVIQSARKWTVHVLPHVHLDLGYTDAQAKVIELHSRNLERASGIIGDSPEYRFTVDGSHTLQHFMRTRDAARRDAIVGALRNGQLGVNAFSVLFLSGLASLEEIYRATDLAFELEESSEIPVRHAHLTDVPSYSGSLPGILRSLGIDAFVGIQNHFRGGNADSDELHLKSPLVWQGLDGQEVLTFFSDSYTQLRFVCTDPPVVPAVEDGLSRLLSMYERPDYLPSDFPLVGTHTDNEDLGDGYAGLVAEWAQHYAYPRLKFSTFGDYLDSVRDLWDDLPRAQGDGGSYWEDAAGTQAAAIAEYRAAQTLLPAAECLQALTSIAYPGITPDRGVLDAAWEDMLIGCEHTWSAWHTGLNPHSHDGLDQLDWKVSRIHRAWRAAREESTRAMSQLAELIGLRAHALVVMNTRSQRRDLVFDVDIEAGARLVDPNGREVAFDVLEVEGFGMVRARVRVPDVDPFGYTSLRMEMTGAAREIAWSSEGSLQTERYSLTVDSATGRIASLVHRASGRELLDLEHEHSLGDVLYVTGGGDAETRGIDQPDHEHALTSMSSYSPFFPKPEITTTRAEMSYVGYVRTPNGVRVRLEGRGPTLPSVTVDLELSDDSDGVELTVQLDKEHELAKESVYVAFPFAAPNSSFRYDRQSGWVDPAQDHMPGACNDWFAVQSGVSVETADGAAIVLATAHAPLVTLEPVQGEWATQPVRNDGAVYSWVMNNYWNTNTPASQGGRVVLRYAFAPMAEWDEAAATRFVRDFRAPALVDRVIDQDRTDDLTGALLPPCGVLLDAEAAENVDLRVYTLKTGPGLQVRAQETSGHDAEFRVRHPRGDGGLAWRTTPAGRRLEPLTPTADGWITLTVKAREDVTVEVCMDGADR